MKKILILVNDVTTIMQFRTELVKALVAAGNKVFVSVPKSERNAEIEALGATVIETSASRHGTNPVEDFKLFLTYIKLLKEQKPDVVLTYTVKPNSYGGMACGLLNVPYMANVTGLGVIENEGLLQKLMLMLYKFGCRKAKCVFFQNKSNLEFFQQRNVVGDNVQLLPGSGVNIEKFSYLDYPQDEKINVVFVGRIIKDKGVFELAEVAKQYLNNSNVQFTIVGDVEYGSENPFSELPNVNCVGFHRDVRPFLKDAHAVILPSYHEGMANVLLEGASSGRPILASVIPGCQETFDEGITGFGFRVKNAQSIKEAIDKFLSLSNEQKCEMGKKGREKMEKQFNRNIVINKYLTMINN
ncbi:MAG: glycosyltransferase family 4 protein [Clostridia bacterium]|nr:glycosyltransferase family 4 protein [Clostridia bacterium]